MKSQNIFAAGLLQRNLAAEQEKLLELKHQKQRLESELKPQVFSKNASNITFNVSDLMKRGEFNSLNEEIKTSRLVVLRLKKLIKDIKSSGLTEIRVENYAKILYQEFYKHNKVEFGIDFSTSMKYIKKSIRLLSEARKMLK